MRIKAEYDWPALTLWRANVSTVNRPLYDKNIESVKLLEQIGTNLIQIRQKTHRIVTVAPRDLFQMVLSNAFNDGTIMTICYDTIQCDLPATPGCVRMRCPLAGFKVSPNSKHPKTKCRMDCIIETSIGGNIPQFIQAIVVKDTAYGFDKLKPLMAEWYKEWKDRDEKEGITD